MSDTLTVNNSYFRWVEWCICIIILVFTFSTTSFWLTCSQATCQLLSSTWQWRHRSLTSLTTSYKVGYSYLTLFVNIRNLKFRTWRFVHLLSGCRMPTWSTDPCPVNTIWLFTLWSHICLGRWTTLNGKPLGRTSLKRIIKSFVLWYLQ